jgi:hypothetical protein
MTHMPQQPDRPTRRDFFRKATAALVTASVAGSTADAQTSATSSADSIMMTIFLRHDETKTLDEINAHLDKTGFHRNFPPQGVEVISWYVLMGIGQVVTLKFPPAKLNLQIEHGAWGAFHTEFYPTYDYRPMWEASKKEGR